MFVKNGQNLPYFNFLIFMSIWLLIIVILAIWLLQSQIREKKSQEQHQLLKRQSESQLVRYQQVKENLLQQRRKSHEYKNQLLCIQGLLSDGKEGEAMEYVKKITSKLSSDMSEVNSKHPIVNAILNQKYLEAHQNVD